MKKVSLIILLSLIFYSCDRIKQKTEQITEGTKKEVKEQIERQVKRVEDKVFPPFDNDKSDTENNKKRFVVFLKVELTDDIKNIYCFDDAIGIDVDYMFSFNCNISTSKKIIKTNKLSIDTINVDNAFGLQSDFDWWNKKRIAELQKYSWTDGNQYCKYYWYDKIFHFFFSFNASFSSASCMMSCFSLNSSTTFTFC